jgi:hypothetical protein
VRRLLLRRCLYGITVGPVWTIFPNDLEGSIASGAPGRPLVRRKGCRRKTASLA